MKNLLIDYKSTKKVSSQQIEEILSKLSSKKHSVVFNFSDYSLGGVNKDIPESIQWKIGYPALNYHAYNYESINDHKYALSEIIETSNPVPDCFLKLVDSIDIVPGIIDKLNLDCFDDNNYAFIYSDFYIQHGNTVAATFHKSVPLVNNTIPIVVFSCKTYFDNISNENTEGVVITNFLGKHIPEFLSTILE